VDDSRQVFHSSFGVLWRWTTTLCGAIGAGIYFFAWMLGTPLLIAPTAILSGLIGILFAVVVVLFPVIVLPQGIRCYNYFGFYSTVPWDAMNPIKRSSVFGLRYLAVGSGWGRIYIPLYLSDMERFIETVKQRTSEDHPLVRALGG